MPFYSLESDSSADPGDLRELFADWRSWLIETGDPAPTNQVPLGVGEHEGPVNILRDVVPLAPTQEIYRRYYRDATDLRFLAPRAASVLAIGNALSISYFGAVLPTTDIQSAPGAYMRASCLFAIPRPSVDDLELRVYRLSRIRDSVMVEGTRHDRAAGSREFIQDAVTGETPRISALECEALAEIGRACMMFVSDREKDASRNS